MKTSEMLSEKLGRVIRGTCNTVGCKDCTLKHGDGLCEATILQGKLMDAEMDEYAKEKGAGTAGSDSPSFPQILSGAAVPSMVFLRSWTTKKYKVSLFHVPGADKDFLVKQTYLTKSEGDNWEKSFSDRNQALLIAFEAVVDECSGIHQDYGPIDYLYSNT